MNEQRRRHKVGGELDNDTDHKLPPKIFKHPPVRSPARTARGRTAASCAAGITATGSTRVSPGARDTALQMTERMKKIENNVVALNKAVRAGRRPLRLHLRCQCVARPWLARNLFADLECSLARRWRRRGSALIADWMNCSRR